MAVTTSLPTTSPGGMPASTPVVPQPQTGPVIRFVSATLNPGETTWFSGGSGQTLTLPQPATTPKNTIANVSSNSVTLAPAPGETLVNLAGTNGSITIPAGQAITVQRYTNGTGVTGWVEVEGTGSGGGGGGGTANSPAVTGALATNLGATQALATSQATPQWLVGTLSANLVVTLSTLAAGVEAVLFVIQPASGGPFTLSVSDGTNTQAVTINSAPGALTVVRCSCPDASNILVG